ncbi:inositol monophosphatase family protein [Pseudooceanicola sp. C21-150M6]|uniref:inositol monophosphatase family protein n=1 Tax=Pseudooceanicola sp. C21-150M6 TaxID=3434355 RepID=UPI003D7FAF89
MRYLPDLAAEMFATSAEVQSKGDSGLDFVTSLDLSLQARLSADLAAMCPGSAVTGEEGFTGAALGGAGDHWLVDPLDGTVNFVAGFPNYAIAVALLRDGVPVLAAVHDVVRGQTFSAHKGAGAFLNGAPVVRRDHQASLAVMSSGLLRDLAERDPASLSEILQSAKLRNLGCQSLHLCYAAAGHLSFVASREAKAWDDLAGALIAREAGLQYGHYTGAAAPPPAADQYSLCAPAGQFSDLAGRLAGSVSHQNEDHP